jgi:hypothetical protein
LLVRRKWDQSVILVIPPCTWQVVGICFFDNYGAMIHFVVLWVFGWLMICGYGSDLWNDLLMIERENLWLVWYGV